MSIWSFFFFFSDLNLLVSPQNLKLLVKTITSLTQTLQEDSVLLDLVLSQVRPLLSRWICAAVCQKPPIEVFSHVSLLDMWVWSVTLHSHAGWNTCFLSDCIVFQHSSKFLKASQNMKEILK